jgi:PAS domain S-box-containing protein
LPDKAAQFAKLKQRGKDNLSHETSKNPPATLLDWLSATELHRIQVRELTQYAMFVLDPAGILMTWNAGVRHILGYSEEEWVGKHASIIFTPADKGREICMAEMKIAAEKGVSADVRWHVRKDGSELFGNGCMTALRDDAGALVGYSKIFSDETKSKQLQDSLTESNAALEQFAYVASHDLQEPLRTIISFSEILVRRYRSQLDSEAWTILDLIMQGAKRMNALIQDLLTYARVRIEVDRPSSYSLDEDVETALSQLKGAIDETTATITHDPLPELQADQGQMVRLFQNLIGNALKYRRREIRPVVHISSRQQGNEWLIAVQDNGIGFDPKHAKAIFAPFKRLHSREEFEGTGVGLAICQRIVENHGGRIWADSKPGEGTTFFFTMPAGGKAPAKQTVSVLEDIQP